MKAVHNSEKRSSSPITLDWFGQMMASMLWAISVFVYGINETGDVLQLCAALAWMVANIASFISAQSKADVHVGPTENNN